jgi:hypothetical protein
MDEAAVKALVVNAAARIELGLVGELTREEQREVDALTLRSVEPEVLLSAVREAAEIVAAVSLPDGSGAAEVLHAKQQADYAIGWRVYDLHKVVEAEKGIKTHKSIGSVDYSKEVAFILKDRAPAKGGEPLAEFVKGEKFRSIDLGELAGKANSCFNGKLVRAYSSLSTGELVLCFKDGRAIRMNSETSFSEFGMAAKTFPLGVLGLGIRFSFKRPDLKGQTRALLRHLPFTGKKATPTGNMVAA